MKNIILGLFLMVTLAANALAADIRPALVNGLATDANLALARSALEGARRFEAEAGIALHEFQPASAAQGEQAIRNFAARGFNPVVVVSPLWRDATAKIAADYPETRFVVIGDDPDAAPHDFANLATVLFRDDEAAYLAGILAALSSQNGRIAFLPSGNDAATQRVLSAFRRGALQARPGITVTGTQAGRTILAPDVLLLAAEPLEATPATEEAAKNGKAAFGLLGTTAADSPAAAQPAPAFPEKLLIALTRRADLAVHSALLAARDGKPAGGTQSLGIADGAVDYVIVGATQAPPATAALSAVETARQGFTATAKLP